jgi:hypothetical protein
MRPIPHSMWFTLVRKLACGTMKPSSNTWHNQLGHPSFFNFSSDYLLEYIYMNEHKKQSNFDACPKVKSHLLPYPTCTNVLLVFHEVCVMLQN